MSHEPTLAQFLIIVSGYMVVLFISLGFLIYYLRLGLDSHSSVIIDPKPVLPSAEPENIKTEAASNVHTSSSKTKKHKKNKKRKK